MLLNVGQFVIPPWINKLCVPPAPGCRTIGKSGLAMDTLGYAMEKLAIILNESLNVNFVILPKNKSIVDGLNDKTITLMPSFVIFSKRRYDQG